jgi:hypothetical protein
MELHSLFHNQHIPPYASLSRTMITSTPDMLLCKNRFLHAALKVASWLINRDLTNRENDARLRERHALAGVATE